MSSCTFQQGGDLRFIDPRTFGEMFVARRRRGGQDQRAPAPRDRPLDQVFTWPTFQYLLAQRAMKMKPLMMDQKFISGLGNIYSDEVLFHAGLRFDRSATRCRRRRSAGSTARSRRCCRTPSNYGARRWRTRPTSTCSASRASTARAEGVRPRGPAVSPLPHRHPEREALPAQFLLLPAVPELIVADGRRGCVEAPRTGQTRSAPASRIRDDRTARRRRVPGSQARMPRRHHLGRVAERPRIQHGLDHAVVGGESRDDEALDAVCPNSSSNSVVDGRRYGGPER